MYAKVFRGLFYGSMIGQADTQLVFICLLSHADADGHVELPSQVISAVCGMSLERVQTALGVLEAPDAASRTDVLEGRRLESTGLGRWMIVNYGKYRAMRDKNDRERQTREAVARHRARKCKPSVSHGKPVKAHVEVEVEVEESKTTPPSPPAARAARSAGSSKNAEPDGFAEFYAAHPRHIARRAAAKAYASALKRGATTESLLCGARSYAAASAGQQHVKHPATWLNGDCWLDEPAADDAEDTSEWIPR